MEYWGEFSLGPIFLILFVIFGIPVLVIIGWAFVRGSSEGVSLWRTLVLGLILALVTLTATVWWVFWGLNELDGRGILRSITGGGFSSVLVVLAGIVAIPAICITSGVWLIKRIVRSRTVE